MTTSALTIRFADGDDGLVYPSRAIAAVATGEEETAIWHFNPAGLIERVTVYVAVKHVREALGLEGEPDTRSRVDAEHLVLNGIAEIVVPGPVQTSARRRGL